MTGRLARILRHPVKSAGLEEIDSAPLEQGGALPFDREWAIVHDRAKIARRPDGYAESWGQKANFLTGRAGAPLMGITCRSIGPMRWRFEHPALPALDASPDDPAGQAALIAWLAPLWPVDAPAPVAIVRGPGQPLSDQPAPCLSLIGTASLDDVSARAGQALSQRRFRANLWVEGWPPFAEFDLVGRHMRIGTAVFSVTERVGRCRATDVDPDTGARDIDMLRLLEASYGHTDLGIFLTVAEPGTIRRGDRVEVL